VLLPGRRRVTIEDSDVGTIVSGATDKLFRVHDDPEVVGVGSVSAQGNKRSRDGLFGIGRRGKLNAHLSGDPSMTATASWISKKPDRCGGDACVRETRITVWGLVAYRHLGMADAEIVRSVQGLTAADLEAAWKYAAAHAEEIDEAIRANEEGEEGFVE
jgi:uncharacterized protein (DUF433 family)